MKYSKISGFSDEIDRSIVTQFTVLKKLGIGYFEPRGIDGKNISVITDEEVKALKENMKKYGIKASSIGSPIGKIDIADAFDGHFEIFKRVVAIAKALNAKYIRMFSFYHNGGEWTAEERNEVIFRLKTMIEYAKENGVILLHENEKDIYGDTIERCKDLMDTLYCDNFKAVFDFANFVQCGQDTKKAYEIMKPYIEYVHIKDAVSESGAVVPSGYGDGNIEYILSDLFGSGFDGYLSLEPHLGSFEGLEGLEMGDIMKDLPKSGEGTFTVAYNALNNILDRIGE
ncbi:MAG: sugar phosphate isomerase/epimerase [Clostridia bacterium]|nr:sugar phosphate isomerase/epimerase [Clostridia bacterium]